MMKRFDLMTKILIYFNPPPDPLPDIREGVRGWVN
jgi:hypothetical protein